MARKHLAYACLLATLVVAGAMPSGAEPSDQVIAKGPACQKSGDDSGWGGTHVKCYYSCGVGALTAIGVKATDTGAYTYGSTDCGGADAACAEPWPICVGVSTDTAGEAQESALCSGHSEEWIDSPVLVACIATVPGTTNAEEILCDDYNICPKPGPNLLGHAQTLLETVTNLCLPHLEPELGDIVLNIASILGDSEDIDAFVGARASQGSIISVLIEDGECQVAEE